MIEVERIRALLLDPNFSIEENSGIIEEVKRIYDEANAILCSWMGADEIVELLLLRLRSISPHIYAITVGQFSGFGELDDYWDKRGFKDTEGYHWLQPKAFGPYVEWKFHG